MTLPASWNQVTVTGTYTNRDGTPASGWVTFESRQIVVVDGVTVVPRTITAQLDGTGYFSVQVPSTNDPDISVTGWAYLVTEHIKDGRPPFLAEIPYSAGTIDIASITPAVPSPSVPVLTGLYVSDIGQSVASNGYIYDSLSAVARTVPERLYDAVSVLDFGVENDGSDQTAALQAAFSDSEAFGFALHFPAGTYVADGLAYGGPGLYLDEGAILTHAAGSGGTLLTLSNGAVLQGGVIDGNASNKTGSPLAVVCMTGREVVEGVTFRNHRNKVVILQEGRGGRVIRNRFKDNGTIASCDQVQVKTPGAVVAYNDFENIGDGHCIRLGYNLTDSVRVVSDCVVIGNTIKDTEHVGLIAELGAVNNLFAFNTVDGAEAGCKSEISPDSSDNTFAYNTFRNLTNNVGTCFNVSGDRTKFIGNTIENCLSGPFFGNDAICTGNTFRNCGTVAAYLIAFASAGTNTGGIFADNVAYNTTGGFVNIGNGATVRGNRAFTVSGIAYRLFGSNVDVDSNRATSALTGYSLVSTLVASRVENNWAISCTTPLSNASAPMGNRIQSNYGCADTVYLPVIASGAITVGQFDRLIRVDTEAAAATDDLVTITGGTLGQELILWTVSSAKDVVLKDGTGNLRLAGDCTLGVTNDRIRLVSDGTNWIELGRSING